MNNYDTSSTGTDIELNVSYDSDLARIYYKDFINNSCGEEPVLQLDLGGRDNYAYIIGDISKPFYKVSHLTKMKKADLVELCEVLLGDYSFDGDDYTKAELVDELMGISIENYYKQINEHYSYSDFQDKIVHDWYTSRGYSQGDASIIIKIDGDLTDSYKTYIDHILWDTPIYFRITINDEDEYYESEFLDDIYEYDKHDVIEKVKAHETLPEDVKEWVIDNLPDYPKSNY
jgi:hypothetical protein